MADRYNLIRSPKLAFGQGRAGDIPDLLKSRGKKMLIVTGSTSYLKNQEIHNLITRLDSQSFDLNFERIGKEPTPQDINSITGKYDPDEIDVVLAVGGGSVLDAGKAVSAMLEAQGDVSDYLEGVGTKIITGNKKYFVAVPTTAGTGSEATSNAVISQTGPGGYKKSLRHENFVPDLAVIDPLLALDCPADITANTGLDALTQLIESYVSVKANPFTDALALDGIAHVRDNLEEAVQYGHNIEARSGMAYAAFISGITLANAGLGLIHGFASAIGGYFYVPHGVVCGTLMGVVNRFNVKALLKSNEHSVAKEKYSRLGKLLSGNSDADLRWCMEYAADYIEDLIDTLKIRRLGEFGIKEQDIDLIVASSDHKANPVTFSDEEMKDMLKLRL